MTCEDCIHQNVCKAIEEGYGVAMCDADFCGCFQDRSRFIELPCKPGDTVYMLNRDKTKVQEMVFERPDIRCHCSKDDEFSCCMPVCNDYQHGICAYRFYNDFHEIGETVFLTREEADQALKERENNDR